MYSKIVNQDLTCNALVDAWSWNAALWLVTADTDIGALLLQMQPGSFKMGVELICCVGREVEEVQTPLSPVHHQNSLQCC